MTALLWIPLNAPFPAVFKTLLLIVIFLSTLHFWNAFLPMDVNPVLLIVIFFSFTHPAKAESPMVTTFFPMTAVAAFLKFLKADAATEVTL